MASEILFPEPTIGVAELTLLANDKSPMHSLRTSITSYEPTGGASHLFQNAENKRVLGIVVKTYPIAMLTMQLRRYVGIRVCVAFL